MPNEQRPLKVFLSYASQDRSVVRELSRRLVGEGWINTWLDEKSLLPGQDWRLKIEEAVEDSDIVIICLSSNSVTKEGYVQKELRYAREIALEKPEETIFLVPLRLDECDVPRGLRFYQWADYFGEKKEETYSALIESLKLRHNQKLMLEEQERVRKEKLEREAAEQVARENADKEAIEEARLEAEERARQNAAREKAEEEKAGREKEECKAAGKIAWEKVERGGAENLAEKKAAREKAERDAAEKVKQEIADKLKTGEPKPVEEKLAIRTSQVETKVTGSQTAQRNLGKQAAFWVIGFVVILVIGILALNNRSNLPTFALTATRTLLSEADTAFPTNTILPNKTPTQGIIPTASPSPVPSAKGTGKIVFVSTRDGNEEIYVMNSDGSDRTRLTQNPGKDVLPAWSPDGTKIAFFSDREVGDGLYVMNFDGSEQRPLIIPPKSEPWYEYTSFGWSPDGKKIVFETFYDDCCDLSIISLDTLSQVKLTTTPNESESQPVWSPDGSKIAFSRYYPVSCGPNCFSGYPDGPFVIDTDGSNEINVFEGDNLRSNPKGYARYGLSWSPDSSKILFGLDKYPEGEAVVLVVELDSLNSRKITAFSNGDRGPVWSPDGSEIAFLARAQGVYQIFLANADGTNVRQLSELKDNRGQPGALNWSADGKRLVFSYYKYPENDHSLDIYVIDVESGELANLSANEQYDENSPVWSP